MYPDVFAKIGVCRLGRTSPVKDSVTSSERRSGLTTPTWISRFVRGTARACWSRSRPITSAATMPSRTRRTSETR